MTYLRLSYLLEAFRFDDLAAEFNDFGGQAKLTQATPWTAPVPSAGYYGMEFYAWLQRLALAQLGKAEGTLGCPIRLKRARRTMSWMGTKMPYLPLGARLVTTPETVGKLDAEVDEILTLEGSLFRTTAEHPDRVWSSAGSFGPGTWLTTGLWGILDRSGHYDAKRTETDRKSVV